MNTHILALTTDDLHPAGLLNITTPLWIAGIAACVLVIALVITVIVLSRPRRARTNSQGVHATTNDRAYWLNQVNAVVDQSRQHTISDEEAYAQLAAIARDFAQDQSGRSMQASTLRDLERRPEGGHAANWDQLRLTIAALYPPEFAHADYDSAAQEANVATAAGWVADLIERWRS